MSGLPKFGMTKQKSAQNLYKMDMNGFNEFENVSDAQASSTSLASLNYDHFDKNADYRKTIIVSAGCSPLQPDGFVQKYEIFENIDMAKKVLFVAKVNLFGQLD